jgi:glutathione synthase/RimK-type ligase-like ATP-grasp enzyme
MGVVALDVIVVADADDMHCDAVCKELSLGGSTAIRFNLANLRATPLVTGPDWLELQVAQQRYRVSRETCAWWRRAGVIETGDLDDEEAQLAFDEGPHLLIGALAAAGVRFVDDPFTVARAETKQFQLAVAHRLGIAIPATCVTNEPAAARAFASGRRVIAKAVSSGIGIAPFVADVLESEFDAVSTLPTMLQEHVHASADIRAVVVSGSSWIWRRPRQSETVDWRQIDQMGAGFEPVANEELGIAAQTIATALGLSISVQDWLETDHGPVFLESNAQGAWLFLSQSRELLAPAIARHLKA